MSARSKGRRKLYIDGDIYYWYIADEIWLRIYSEDKQFVVQYELLGADPLLTVHGQKFEATSEKKRPIWMKPPAFQYPIGPQFVKDLILWGSVRQPDLEINPGMPEGPLERLNKGLK